MKYARVFLVATSILFVMPSVCWGQMADNAAIAEALFQEAQRLINEGHVTEACVKFVESDKLDPGLGTKLSIADCYEKEGKLAAAWAIFSEIIPLAQRAKRKDREEFAKTRADALAPRVPKLVIVMDGADPTTVQVLRDGLAMGAATFGLPLPIDPGNHVIIARSLGFKEWSKTVIIEEGKTFEVKVPALGAEVAAPVPQPPPSTPTVVVRPPLAKQTNVLRAGGFVAIGVGVAGLIGFGVTGGLAISKKATVEEHCTQLRCDLVGFDALKEGRPLANLATGALAVGTTGVAVGTILLIIDRGGAEKETTKSGARVTVIDAGPLGMTLGVKGVF